MNQTAGVSNHVRCSGKGSKVRAAGVRHRGERWGCLVLRPRPPVPLSSSPCPQTYSRERVPAAPPANPSLGEVEHPCPAPAAARAVQPPPRRVPGQGWLGMELGMAPGPSEPG